MRTAPLKNSSPTSGSAKGKPRFKCSEVVVLRFRDTTIQTQCLEIGEDSILLEAEQDVPARQELAVEIPSQRIRRDGEVISCDLDMGMFRIEVNLQRGQLFDPIAITMYPLLHALK
jgi:hypothetical protein